MALKIQVLLTEEELSQFKSEAMKQKVSLSRWLRDAGKMRLTQEPKNLKDPKLLKLFFEQSNKQEIGTEEDWSEMKKLISLGKKGKLS